MVMKTIINLLLCQCLIGLVTAQCDGTFRFASYYGSHMVLQRAPVFPVVWGHAAEAGRAVEIQVDTEVYNTETYIGPGDTPIWKVQLSPKEVEAGPVVISATLDSCTITISDVLYGDVYVCSGQSNMRHELERLNNAEQEIADAVNYPNVRNFHVGMEYANETQYDLIRVERGWTIPNHTNMAPFSAVCWLFGKNMNQELGIPIGLIQSCRGGIRIEAYTSPESLDVCFPEGVEEGDNVQNGPSVTWNAMIHPLLPMPIFGVVWYQGEANTGNYEKYTCAITEMVRDWRQRWFTESMGTMDEQFPFGQVQLAPTAPGDCPCGFAFMRWEQTTRYGYTPNPQLPNVYTAVVLDLPDYDSPYGSTHPRYKRKVAERLAYGAYQVAYGITTHGPYQGPIPTSAVVDGTSVVVTYDDGVANIEVRTNGNFDLCCADVATDKCDDDNGIWQTAVITSNGTSTVTLENVCSNSVTGLRYAWRNSPCDLEQCAVYRVENELPAPPYLLYL